MDVIELNKMTYEEFFGDVLKWLMVGMSLTFISSILVSFSGLLNYIGFLFFILPVIEIIMVIFLIKRLWDLSYVKSKNWYIAYSIINGVSFALIIDYVAPGAFALSTAMTAVYFGLLYVIVSHTSYDYIGVGKVCGLMLIPLLIGFIICILFRLAILYMIFIVVDLVLFTGITLYDLKQIRQQYESSTIETQNIYSLNCAFNLYLDFINIFYDIVLLISDFG